MTGHCQSSDWTLPELRLDTECQERNVRSMSVTTGKQPDLDVDVIIVGSGMIGATLAVALGGAGLRVALIDRLNPATMVDVPFDGRASAIAYASYRALDAIGAWRHMGTEAQPILDIRVSEGDSLLFLHYDHRELGDGPLGFMLENRHLRRGLFAAISEITNITLLAPSQLDRLDRTEGGVVAHLIDGLKINGRLAVGADGRNSPVREAAGIRVQGWSYEQSGIVCTVAHEHPHRGVAHERFLTAGPFAILPLTGNRVSLVWTEPSAIADRLIELEESDFNGEMRERFGDFLGYVEAVGPRWRYPLSLHNAETYIDHRLALVGDAAHGMHPIAGQGLNLGFRDVAALAEVMIDAARLGLDIGNSNVLSRYETWRRFDSMVLLAVTDGLNRLFSNDVGAVRAARDVGLAAVNQVPPLKRFFMRHARGTVGKLPRILKGTAL